MSIKQPVILVILDGWGINPRKEGNAIAQASIPNIDKLTREFPVSSLSMSGVDVGLPEGQMGNSEVGHMILGAGRIVYQDLTLIHKDIDEGGFYKNKNLLDAMKKTRDKSGRLHLLGLLGDGGVHSHQRHMEALIEMARREKVGTVYLHLFLDGRDTPPNSAEQFVLDLLEASNVLVVHGSGFGSDPRAGNFRMVYLAGEDLLGSAFDAIERSLPVLA